MNLIIGKGRVILKLADAWIGKPRRHSALSYGFADRVRQRLNLLIRHQGHRTDFAGSMATLTVALENRQDLLAGGERGYGRLLQRGHRVQRPSAMIGKIRR